MAGKGSSGNDGGHLEFFGGKAGSGGNDGDVFIGTDCSTEGDASTCAQSVQVLYNKVSIKGEKIELDSSAEVTIDADTNIDVTAATSMNLLGSNGAVTVTGYSSQTNSAVKSELILSNGFITLTGTATYLTNGYAIATRDTNGVKKFSFLKATYSGSLATTSTNLYSAYGTVDTAGTIAASFTTLTTTNKWAVFRKQFTSETIATNAIVTANINTPNNLALSGIYDTGEPEVGWVKWVSGQYLYVRVFQVRFSADNGGCGSCNDDLQLNTFTFDYVINVRYCSTDGSTASDADCTV